ncbi:DNA-binding response regulator, partial [Streptomyces massasporeus]
MPTPIRVLLADDHTLVRRGVRLILDGEPDLTVVAEAGAQARQSPPTPPPPAHPARTG